MRSSQCGRRTACWRTSKEVFKSAKLCDARMSKRAVVAELSEPRPTARALARAWLALAWGVGRALVCGWWAAFGVYHFDSPPKAQPSRVFNVLTIGHSKRPYKNASNRFLYARAGTELMSLAFSFAASRLPPFNVGSSAEGSLYLPANAPITHFLQF